MTINEINKELQRLLAHPHSIYETYRMFLASLFAKYYDLLKESKDDLEQYCFIASPYKDLLEEVQSCSDYLLGIYDLYISGHVGDAVERMRKHFTPEESMFTDEVSSLTPMYRARVNESFDETFGVKEMFHVPFENRSKIASSRFSITGYPCLYLGSTILACWEEMQKPIIDNLSVSRFLLQNGVSKNVINLCWHDELDFDLKSVDDEEHGLLQLKALRLLRRFPLMLACSVKASNPNAPFKEEYVLPQVLLLSCIDNEHVDGIAYTSTRRDDQISSNIELHQNFVFPSQNITDVGYCSKLASDFQLTKGVSFMEADIKNVFYGKGMPYIHIENETLCLDTLDNGKSEYQCSKFGQMEEYLNSQPLYELYRIKTAWYARQYLQS